MQPSFRADPDRNFRFVAKPLKAPRAGRVLFGDKREKVRTLNAPIAMIHHCLTWHIVCNPMPGIRLAIFGRRTLRRIKKQME